MAALFGLVPAWGTAAADPLVCAAGVNATFAPDWKEAPPGPSLTDHEWSFAGTGSLYGCPPEGEFGESVSSLNVHLGHEGGMLPLSAGRGTCLAGTIEGVGVIHWFEYEQNLSKVTAFRYSITTAGGAWRLEGSVVPSVLGEYYHQGEWHEIEVETTYAPISRIEAVLELVATEGDCNAGLRNGFLVGPWTMV